MTGGAGWWKLGMVLVAMMAASAAPAQVANDYLTNAFTLNGGTGSTNGSNVGATTNDPGEAAWLAANPTFDPPNDSPVDNSVWFVWKAPSSGTAEFDTFNSQIDGVLAVFTTNAPGIILTNAFNMLNNWTNIAASDSSQIYGYEGQLTFFAVSNQTYYIAVYGNAGQAPADSGTYTLNWNLVSNDYLTNSAVLTGNSGSVTNTNVGATTNDTGEATWLAANPTFDPPNDSPVDNSVWYAWTAPAYGTAEFDTFNSQIDGVLGVFTTANTADAFADPTWTEVAGSDSSLTYGYEAQVTFQTVPNQTYYIAVYGNAGQAPSDSGVYTLNWNLSIPTNSSGTLGFASSRSRNGIPLYEVSSSDGNSPIDNSVAPDSVQGARLTVTRTGGSSGRIIVGYQISGLQYTNILRTNDFGTNIISITISTNSSGATVIYTNGGPEFANGLAVTNGQAVNYTNGQAVTYASSNFTLVSFANNAAATYVSGDSVSYTNGAAVTYTNPTSVTYATNIYAFYNGGFVAYTNGQMVTYTNGGLLTYLNGATAIYTNGTTATYTNDQAVTYTNGATVTYTNATTAVYPDTLAIYTNSLMIYANGQTVIYTNGGPVTYLNGTTAIYTNAQTVAYTNGATVSYPNGATASYASGATAVAANGTTMIYTNGAVVNYPRGTALTYVNGVTMIYGSGTTVAFGPGTTVTYPNAAAVIFPTGAVTYTNDQTVTYGGGWAVFTNATLVTYASGSVVTYSNSQTAAVSTTFLTGYSSNTYSYFNNGYQSLSLTNASTNVVQVGISLGQTFTAGGVLLPTPTNSEPPFSATGFTNTFSGAPVTNSDGTLTTIFTNIFQYPSVLVTQVVSSATAFTIGNGTVTLDDYQMSADIVVPLSGGSGPDSGVVSGGVDSYAQVTLTSVQLDPLESPDLEQPGISPITGTAFISALNPNFAGYSGVFNFERATFRVDRDVNGGAATIYVNRVGGNPQDSVTVDYVITPQRNHAYPYDMSPGNPQDFLIANDSFVNDVANTFALQAGSDYARPNVDYTPVTGTLSWGGEDYAPKAITIPILDAGDVQFNQDFLVQLHNPLPAPQPPPGDPGMTLGQVNAANVTILFDDKLGRQQPAGSMDRTWNKDNAADSNPPFLQYPGTDGGVSDGENGNNGTVYAIAEQTNGEAVIGGSFVSYDSQPYNRVARILSNGYQDPSFMAPPNSGANSFVAAVAMEPNGQILIAGNFTSFNGTSRNHIARLNSDGSLDTTFNPGLGANGMIWSMALETNGQIVVGGAFTTFNTNNFTGVARLNPDGSVDTTFNPGAGPDGVVRAVAVDALGNVIMGGQFAHVDGISSGGIARLTPTGALDSTFTPGVGTYNPNTGGTDPIYAIAVEPNGQILVGGGFSFYQLDTANGLARLNADGTLDTTFASGTGTFNPVTGTADAVYAITLQPDGNILIGGNFTMYNQTRRVGVARLFVNGTLDTSFMDTAYNQYAGVPNHYHNPNAINTNLYPPGNDRNYVYAVAVEPFTTNVLIGGGFLRVGGGNARDDIHNRSNVARLIGGGTPGPGNVQLVNNSYSQDKDAGNLFVTMVRTNGNLGIVQATFTTNTAVPGPGVAVAGRDFSLSSAAPTPTWDTAWYNGAGAWMYDFGTYGPNNNLLPGNPESAGATIGNPSLYIAINNNTNITGNETAHIGLTAPNGTDIFKLGGETIPLGVALGTQISAPLTIIDDNVQAGSVSFSSPTFSVIENQGVAVITVVLTNDTAGVPVSVNYSTSPGTAVAAPGTGADYTNASGTLTFQSSGSLTFTVPIINGTVTKPDKTVLLKLSSVTGGATFQAPTNATLTIINDNYTPGGLSFASATNGVNENAGHAVITVNRLGGSAGTEQVTVIASGGSAVNGTNYIASTNTLVWGNGVAGPTNIIIPVFDDGVVTSNLTVNLRLTNSLVNNIATNEPLAFGGTNAILIITNVDSYGQVGFSSTNFSVKEYGGYALVPVVRTGGSAQTITVTYSTTNGTAVAGTNYIPESGLLTFTNGQVSQFINVPIINQDTVGTLALGLVLSNAVPTNTLGSFSNAVLNIIGSGSVNEPPGSPDGTYSGGFNNTVYALALETNNQLIAGGDFNFADGVPRQRIARLNDDGTLDSTFLQPSSAYGASGSVRALAIQQDGRILVGGLFTNFNSVAINYITRLNVDGTQDTLFNPGAGADNPVYALAETFVNGQSEVMVGGAFATLSGTPINGIARLYSNGSIDPNFNPGLGANGTVYALAVQPTDGKVVIGGDFTSINGNTNFNHIARLNTDGSLDTTFNPGSGASDSVRAIAIQPDGEILIGGLFTNVNGMGFNYIARLTANGSVDTGFTPGVGANAPVFSIALQKDGRIVLGGEFSMCSGVTRNNITRLMPNGTVDPTINFGTGANNFVAAAVVEEDTIAGYPTNVTDEKIFIGGGFTQYNSQSANYLARIYGGSVSGSGAFQFSAPTYSVDERGTNAIITVLRTGGTSGPNNDGSGSILVPFSTSDGSAVAGTNYMAISTNLNFPEGEVQQTISIPVMDDGVITSNLTANLTLAPTDPSEYGNQPTATLTIINDDSAINFTAATYTVPKNIINGVASINIQRFGSTYGTSTVVFDTSGGSATPGTDYTPVGPSVITFAPGASNALVTIPIINNGQPEVNQTVGLQLTDITGSALYSPSNATLTIVNTVTSPGQLSFSATNYSITEGGGTGVTNAIITVVRTLGSAGVVSVGYSTEDGTAISGAKYIATNGVVTFGDGQTNASFVVPVINTSTAEGPEYLNLVLTNAAGGAVLLAPTNATLTILNTNTGLAFVLATNTISETGGTVYNGVPNTALLSVVRYNNTNGTTTVNYATADGTAVNGVNYAATSGMLTFNPGDSVKIVPVQLIHDTNVTGTLTFTVTLSSPSAGAQLTPPSTTVVQELDAEAGLSFISSTNSVLKTGSYVFLPVISSNPNVGPVSVNYATGGGTAVPGVDYAATSGTLTFTNGQQINYIVVPIIPNSLVESNQTFNVTLSSPTAPGVLIPPSTETITIIETNTPPGLNFYSPIAANSDWGSASVDDTLGAALGQPIVWLAWTPTNSGEAQFDTVGSVDDVLGITNLATEMAVYTGTNSANLTELTANGGIYPGAGFNPGGGSAQQNNTAQNIFNVPSSNNVVQISTLSDSIYDQPYAGPSQVRFNAVAGQTYYIAVTTKSETLSSGLGGLSVVSPAAGLVKLNWALHPSGVFRFAQEDLDATGLTYSNGIPMLLYHVSETEATRGIGLSKGQLNGNGGGFRRTDNGVNDNQEHTTIDGTIYPINGTNGLFAYDFDVPGVLVTVTRVGGSSGRVMVGYTTASITSGNLLSTNANGQLVNGDLPAQAGIDYTPTNGTLTFDDSEMSKTIFIPISDDNGVPRQNRDFEIILTNSMLDPLESPDVQAPRLDQTFSTTLVRILDADIDPQGPSQSTVVVTNYNPITLVTNIATNTIFSLMPTNALFNFEKAHYFVTRDITNYWGTTPITVYVNRMGTNESGATVYYRVNNYYLNKNDDNLVNGEFPLQPSSDYATPTPPDSTGIKGLVPDFNFPGGYSGTITFPSGNTSFTPQPITFSIANNGLQQFDEDFTIEIYEEDSKGNPYPCGMVGQTTVTILYDDNHLPAGSVDEYYNADFSYNMAGPVPTTPPEMSHPGTDGEVDGLVVQPDNRTILVGDFNSYDGTTRNEIVRANPDGSLDATFNPGSGPNSFVNCIALTPNYESVIGGAFSSYNGTLRNGIALVATNGSLDTSFNPGQGFNGAVYALAFQTNGELLVGGAFTSYNGSPCKYLALLNLNGTLDTSFNVGTNLNGTVNAVAVQPNGQVIVGGNFTSVAGVSGQNYLARFNPDGSFDPSFDPGSGANAAVFALGLQPDGNLIVGGEFTQMNGRSANYIARVDGNGFTDPNFYSGTGLDGPVYNITVNTNTIFSTTNSAAVVQTNFTVYVGGAFTEYNNTHRLGFARLNADGTLDTTFLDTAYNEFAGLPRERYNDPLGTVLASGIQSDGNVMIGGSFERVGGGQSDDPDVRPESVDTNDYYLGLNSGFYPEEKTRSGIRNRSNVARLIGGATPGPGNVGLIPDSSAGYSVDKSASSKFVALDRANGSLGPATVNFAILPGLAQSEVDYSYFNYNPLYWISWELNFTPMGRMHSDGLYATNGNSADVYGRNYTGVGEQSSVVVNIIDDTNNLSNLSASVALSDPIDSDEFYLGGVDIPLGVALGQSTAPFTLLDDHSQAGTFGFSASDYTGVGSSAMITVTRTNDPDNNGQVTLNYTTTTNGSTAILGSDYAATSGTLTFPGGSGLQTFTVPILNSNSVSTTEKTVNLVLSGLNPPVNSIASLGLSNAVLRIINANFQGFLSLSTNIYSVNLSAGSVTITVNRTVGSEGTLNLQLNTIDGTATNGVDYLGVSTNLQWNSGDVTPRSITIPLINNGNVGSGKQFNVILSNPELNGLAASALFATNAVTNAVVLVNNNNSYGNFQFSAPVYVANENGGYSTITVTRTGGTNGTATVSYGTANATAVAGVNYTATSGTLTFAPNQLAASFNVPIIDDGRNDGLTPSQFYFTVTLSNPSAGAALGALTAATNDIVDAEAYNRPPGSADTTFNSGSGMNGSVFALTLQANGQIVAGGDFSTVNGVPESYLARLNTDGSLDRSGFLYGLSGASGPVYALVNQTDGQILVGGAFTNFNGTILNNIARLNTDGSLDSSFNPGAGADSTVYALAETFINGSRKIYVGGAFASMNGQNLPYLARLNEDGSVDTTFAPGAGPGATVYAVAAYPTNSVFAGKVLIAGAFNNVNNYQVGCVARLNVDGSLDTNFDANVSIGAGNVVRAIAIQSDDRVLIGGDFTNVDGVTANHIARLNSDGTLDTAFAAAVGVGANASVSAIAVQTDGRIVLAGQFSKASGVTRNSITRLLPTGAVDPSINFGQGANGVINAVVIQPADQMLVIGGGFTQYNGQTNNYIARIYGGSVTGSGMFTFSSAGYQVDENGIQALIGIQRIGGTSGTNADGSGNVMVDFATSAGTAVPGVNYSNVNTFVTFPAGEVLEYAAVPVLNNSNVEPNLTVNLALSNPTPPAGLGNQATAVLTIINDNSAVNFGSANYSVPKNILTGVGTIDVARVGSSSGTCSVYLFTTANGTAVPGVDFYPTNLTVTFTPGVTDVVVQVPIINNTNAGPNPTIIFGLTNEVNTFAGSPTNATLTIINTVTSAGQLTFAETNFTADASSSVGFLTVARVNGSSGSVSATFTTVPGTAQLNVNYTTTSGTVSFGDGQTNATIPIALINNPLAEAPVSMSVVLSNPTGNATLVAPTNATLNIVNTNAVIGFAMPTNTYSETAGTVFISVNRYNSTNGTSTVNYATADGTAQAGVNYVQTAGTLTFYPGQSIITIPVTLIHDTNATGTLAFNLNLSNASGAQLALPASTLVQELDAEAGLSFSTNAVSVPKNTNAATITVICANPLVEPVPFGTNVAPLQVNFSTVNGTAIAGQDYMPTNGTLVFTNGIGTNTFTVPIINNTLVDGNHSFSVQLSQPTSPGQLVSPSTEVVTIVDDNTGVGFSSPTYTVLRSGLTATITVVRSDNTNATSTVNFATANGTASAGADYTATNGVLVFTNGVTSQTFQVGVIPSATVQPDKTVLVQLSNPTNATLVSPYVATLTIHDNSGSLVVPAGSAFAPNGDPNNNGLIDTNERVTLLFAFASEGGNSVSNLYATLLATNGVTLPTSSSGTATQKYPTLIVDGPSASMPFTFTAAGTNGQQIEATFNLTNGTQSIGTAEFTYTLGTWSTTFYNTNIIYLNAGSMATPYPSTITVTNLGGVLLKATATLTNVNHTAISSVSALLVAPSYIDTLLMGNVGGPNNVKGLTINFDDAATNSLPQTSVITNGTYKPTSYGSVPSFP